MPGSFESGLRITEHYEGRASATRQARGVFVHMPAPPSLSAGRVVRNRANVITGTYAQPHSSITAHGVRPGGSFSMECMPEDLAMVLMSFFHNRLYTNVSGPSGNIETGTFQFGVADAKPDHTGVVVGTYNPSAGSVQAAVAMADAYTIGLDLLYGHGDIGDENNGLQIDNWITNVLTFETNAESENVLVATVEGFGRDADPLADYAEASFGPGVNGNLSSQAVLVPEVFSFESLTVGGVSKASVYDDWSDAIRIVMRNGFAGRESLGHDEFNAIRTAARPSVEVNLTLAHVATDFLSALSAGQKITLTARFTNGANEYLEFTFPYLKVAQNFEPSVGDPGSDVSVEVPMMAVLDTSVGDPLVEVELKTSFDVRTISFHDNASLEAAV